jgi:hypothetical protein
MLGKFGMAMEAINLFRVGFICYGRTGKRAAIFTAHVGSSEDHLRKAAAYFVITLFCELMDCRGRCQNEEEGYVVNVNDGGAFFCRGFSGCYHKLSEISRSDIASHCSLSPDTTRARTKEFSHSVNHRKSHLQTSNT